MCRLICVLLSVVVGCSAQKVPSRPSFADYPASKAFTGTPAAPKLVSKDQRLFRTRIRTGGDHHGRFAGHYTIAEWGCGTDCSQFAIVDLVTGAVSGPFTVSGMPWSWVERHKTGELEHIAFKPTSRLLKVNGCSDEHDCGFYDYVVEDGQGLKLIRKELLPHEYQLVR
jgi:hypothetical protein